MKDLKTTIAGLVAGLALVVRTIGLDIPQEVLDGIIAVAVFVLGFAARDKA